MKFRKNTKSEKVFNEIRKLKTQGYFNDKRSKKFYSLDTLIRRAAKYGKIYYIHNKSHKIYWLEEYAPKGSLKLTRLIDKRVSLHNKNKVIKNKKLITKKDLTTKNNTINVIIDFNYWILLIILFLLLLLK